MQYELENVSIRMVKEPPLLCSEPVNTPGRAVEVLHDMLYDYDREMLILVNLKTDLTPINVNIAGIGTINSSVTSPRELLKPAILSNAAAVMLFHNHPSGNLTPSQADIDLTDKLIKAFGMMGIPIMDHIILGPKRQYYSMKENRTFPIPLPEENVRIEDLNWNLKAKPKRNRSKPREAAR